MENNPECAATAQVLLDRDTTTLAFPPAGRLMNGTLRIRQMQILAGYVCILAAAVSLTVVSDDPRASAFSLGLMAPGGGFLFWVDPAHSLQVVAVGLFGLCALLFVLSLVIWFATGNAVLPAFVWLASAVGSAFFPDGGDHATWDGVVQAVPLGILIALFIVGGWSVWSWRRGLHHRAKLNDHLKSVCAARVTSTSPLPANAELSSDELRLMRLLLDRALQPVDTFKGFEWIDQFQTAAVRYQVNFISYALSMAQAVHLPAFSGYLELAQQNLIAKQQDYRLWRYWQFENMWGNLCVEADPIPRDNIMLTGFLAGQLAFRRNASRAAHSDAQAVLVFQHPTGDEFVYSEQCLIDVLCKSYRTAKHGLLACEPNWIYPLCNLISVSAIRAHDRAVGTSNWDEIAPAFRHQLESQFVSADGSLVPFRSTLTGLGARRLGGAVMQAFPCLFLNAVLPDIAKRQWETLKYNLKGRSWQDVLWPVDVGNYGFSRASSYAATAAAAVEMGDTEAAGQLLELLDTECPISASTGVAHRLNASLWAHAVELMARYSKPGAFHALVAGRHAPLRQGPYIKDAPYPDVLVAAAHVKGEGLCAVLRAGRNGAFKNITIAGLIPRRSYLVDFGQEIRVTSDSAGEARLNLPLSGRADLRVVPAT